MVNLNHFHFQGDSPLAPTIFELMEKKIVLLDGAMGTELIRHGLKRGMCPEQWNMEKPHTIKEIHKDYYQSGADVVLTNTFGGNQIKLSSYQLEKRCYEINLRAARLAGEVRPLNKFIAGSMGPTGKFLNPYGDYSETDFEEAYGQQAKGLEEGGVDFFLIETQYDLREALCALRAVRKQTQTPAFVTMTFDHFQKGYFTVMGNSVSQCLREFESQKVPVTGANCTLDSQQMSDLVRILRQTTSLPLLVQANAGQPVISYSTWEVSYSQSVEDYVRYIPQMIENGARFIGGCCGTNPAYIRRMSQVLENSNKS